MAEKYRRGAGFALLRAMTRQHTRRAHIIALCGCFCVSLACDESRNEGRTEDSSVIPDPAKPIVLSAGSPVDTVAAERVRWTSGRVAERLRWAGFDPAGGGTVRQPFMSVPGMIYIVKDAAIHVYIYADAIAVARDTDPLDSASVAPSGTNVNWPMPPSLVTANNLAAIVLTRNDETRRRIRAALTNDGNGIPEP